MAGETCYATGGKEAAANTEAILRRLHGKEFIKALLPAGRILFNRAVELAPYDATRKHP